MEVRLKVLIGANAGQELLIPGPRFFIGRAEDCQLRPRSDLISRHHCALMVEESVAIVRDFGSKNGTYVNDNRVEGEIELRSGDKLKVGPLEFEVTLGAGVKKKPKVESVKEVAARTVAGGAGDPDVSQWLSTESSDQKAGNMETRVIAASKVAETTEIDVNTETLGRAGADAAAVSTTAEARPAVDIKALKEKKEPQKLPATAKAAATGDTRNAAADVLNKFFKRR